MSSKETKNTVRPLLSRWRVRLFRAITGAGLSEDNVLVALSLLIGVGTAFGAFGFRALLEWVTALYYEHSRISTGNWTIWLLPLLPASGGLLVGLIVYFFAREAKGHGVPEVMDAIARRSGVIRPRVALAKAVASSLTIGSGGSAGTEGPIIQIGAALGSSTGQAFGRPLRQLPLLVACGAAAGISAIFNAPIAGVLFALEIFLYDLSFRTFAPLVLSSVLASTTMHALLAAAGGPADRALMQTPANFQYQFTWWELGNYLMLGVLAGLVAVAYIKSLYASEDFFDERLRKVHPVIRPVIGGLLLGLLGLGLIVTMGLAETPPIFGNGYAFLTSMLDPTLYGTTLKFTLGGLAVLLAAKLLATCLTLGSGGSGGVFAPSLFLGAALGGAFGMLLRLALGVDVNPAAYAIVGMAAVFAGSTHAVLTAVVMLFEMTHDPRVMLPVLLTVTIATFIAQRLKRDSIYTERLTRRGLRMGLVADTTLLRGIRVEQLPLASASMIAESSPLSELIARASEAPTADFVATDETGRYRGMVVAEDLRIALLEREAVPLLLVTELVRRDIPIVQQRDSLVDVLGCFSRHDVAALPVASEQDEGVIVGLLTRSTLIRRYQEELAKSRGFG